jgi:uncharacterized LabA/DUF88 family protein
MTHAYIDGAFLRDRSSAAIKGLWDVEPNLDFNNIRAALGAFRLFYYDCVEDEPRNGESQGEFTTRTNRQQMLLASIGNANMCHVRLGTLKQQRQGKRISQKEVDVKIAVDMLTHATARTIDRAVLVTGDLDFRPVIESLVQLGTLVELRYDPPVTSLELQQAADVRQELNLECWHSFCSAQFQSEHPLPGRWMGSRDGVGGRATIRQLRTGTLNSRPVRLWEAMGNTYTVEIDLGESLPFCCNGNDDRFLLERFLPARFPGIQWS